MGRLFQYNRFGQEAVHNKKDITTTRSNTKTKESSPAKNSRRTNNKYKALACPGYSELYPEYRQTTHASPTTIPTTATPTKSTEQEMTTSTFMSSSTTLKSVEIAIKKYQQWSNKFLTNNQATATIQPTSTTTTTTTATTSEDSRQSSTSTSLSSSAAASSTSVYHSQQQCRESNTEILVTTAQKKPKVYDCMKGFLKRKLFHQTVEATLTVTQDEEATSDYDEIEVLDSSYNADEENETDTSSTCSCSKTDNESHADAVGQVPKLPSTLKLNCWPNHMSLSDATSTSSISSDGEDEQEDTDAGISDCCQLLTERSPKRRSLMKKKKKLSTLKPCFNKMEDDDLLDATWYQPYLSNKAATERLQQEAPGTFLMRRTTHSFELLVRLETKVKNYSLLNCGKSFKFKEAKKEFSSLKALVTHHSVMAEHLPLTLTLPRPKEREQCRQSLRYADDFDSFESLQILGILKRLQAENLEFS